MARGRCGGAGAEGPAPTATVASVRVLLVSTYELGHQPVLVATAAGALRHAGHEVRAVDLAVEPLPPDLVAWPEAVALAVPMHTAARLARTVAGRLRDERPELPVCLYGLYAMVAAEPGGDGAALATPAADHAKDQSNRMNDLVDVSLSIEELAAAASTTDKAILELEEFGFISSQTIGGVTTYDRDALIAAGHSIPDLLRDAAGAFFKQVFRDGFFHADQHPGNLFVDAAGALAVVDFGIMGRLDRDTRYYLADMLIGFLTGWTVGAPAAILLLAATVRRRDSLREALAPAIGDFPLAVEKLAALSDNAP